MPLRILKHAANLLQANSARPFPVQTGYRHRVHNSSRPPSTYNFYYRSHRAFAVRRRKFLCTYSRYDQGTSQSQRRYSSPSPTNASSAVHSVSFNRQLLIVLCIPAFALGVPFALEHPIFCIVLPLVVYYTPGLQDVVKPLFASLLQAILSGLRPSGSAKSGAYPWQQANPTSWTSPPIDVEYQALPGGPSDAARNHAEAGTGSRNEYSRFEQPSSSYQSTQPRRQTVSVNRQSSSHATDAVSHRRKVSITASQRQSRQNGRIVRQAAPGQVGVNIDPNNNSSQTESNSNLVRVLLGVFPFLRQWGGFL